MGGVTQATIYRPFQHRTASGEIPALQNRLSRHLTKLDSSRKDTVGVAIQLTMSHFDDKMKRSDLDVCWPERWEMPEISHTRPHFTEHDAVCLAWEYYGLQVDVRPLPSERDQNFHLFEGSGEQFVLKIASAAETRPVLDLQNRALDHLARCGMRNFTPAVRNTISGEDIATVKAASGARHFLRLLTFLPGTFLADVRPHTPELLHDIGEFLGRLDRSLAEFDHSVAKRELQWDMTKAASVIDECKADIPEADRRSIVDYFLRLYEMEAAPLFPRLPTGVIHNDANDHNLLVSGARLADGGRAEREITGIIDFGDMLHSLTVAEPAIAAAYCLLGKIDPVSSAAHLISGYHQKLPLTEAEVRAMFPLICIRLALSVCLSARQQRLEPDNRYLSISEDQVWEALSRLRGVRPQFAHFAFRAACGMEPSPGSTKLIDWLTKNRDTFGPVLSHDLRTARSTVIDLSVSGSELAGSQGFRNVKDSTQWIFERMRAVNADIGIGRYNEARLGYTSGLFKIPFDGVPRGRTIHIGIDLFIEPGSPAFAPLDGTIHSFHDNAGALDYGPTVILRHEACGSDFFTLYGHLSTGSLENLFSGKMVRKGEQIGTIGDSKVNGGWPAHLHFQIMADMLGYDGDFPGIVSADERGVWLSLCPDPNLILRIPEESFPSKSPGKEEIARLRKRHFSSTLSISYRRPLNIVRGFGQYLYDECGRAYLDGINNVAHVGHCHPKVVKAGQRQMLALNTNTRYLHENLVIYAERLCATLPEPLRVCFFVNSGSEANDLALRLARARTGFTGVIIVDSAYHGNLSSLIDISPYKFNGPGGCGAPPHVCVVPMPDTYRGTFKSDDPHAGEKYAGFIPGALAQIRQRGNGLSAFVCESALSCGGQIPLPPGYLKAAYAHIRRWGGVCIADEVQVGLGRMGTHFWGFDSQGVIPDVVTIGKSIGNGHPLAAVVTSPEIAASFENGMEYFNTYGGNPVSCAIGSAVLDVIEEEGLQAHAIAVGGQLTRGLECLMRDHSIIGDVRGSGLFLGIEFVSDRTSLRPASAQASYTVERMREHGILLSTDGPLHNVIKIKPPMVLTTTDAEMLLDVLDGVLREDFIRIPDMSHGTL